ncbi:hypothetical protein E6C27_scaffold135G002430 [Cucumis melo var. makuwa]|uniref:Uncharacterized protein n=1 Tax=Cucumis melo var. makuwa TaxID=1194695 RepID=A0A5A7UDI6_CUCMM|nr:hypothetical protein E6C27_scaffold135G002430 [Cucumis melo var. makuwa]
MGQKIFTFFLLFLAFSFLLSSSSSFAVPTTRILKSTFERHPSYQALVHEDVRDLEIIDGDSFERLFEGRLILENNDYPGTGANNHHDPKSPARP